MLIPVGNGNYNFRCDNSTLEKFQYCQREGKFYVWNRRGGKKSAALNLGGALHEAWELLYLHGYNEESITLCYQRIIDHYNADPTSDDWRTCEFALDVIKRYYEYYSKGDPIVPLVHDNAPFVETAFEIKLGELEINDTIVCPVAGAVYVKTLNIYWIGKIDIACRQHDRLWVCDHKTTSRLGSTFWNKFQLSSQMLGYSWALQQLLGETPAGVILNVAALRKPTRTGKSCEFIRQSFMYTEDAILEWRDDTLTSIADFVSSSVRGEFPPSKCNCIRVYGQCSYFDACCLKKEARARYLMSSDFETVTWDPTKE